jgi:NAD dependent epimerase/dehydratase family enzyme
VKVAKSATSMLGASQNGRKTFSTMSPESDHYTVAITGASGLLGTAVIDELSRKKEGKLNGKPLRVIKLYRSENVKEAERTVDKMITMHPWNPEAESSKDSDAIDKELLESIDAVVHLAGENVGSGLLPGPLGMLGIQAWSEEKKDLIMKSRVGPTKALANAISKSARPTSFIVASGVGVYGNDFMADGEDRMSPDESSDVSRTTGFLADVSREWELASQPAAHEENRVVNLRLAPIMSKLGGALGKLYPIFFLGGGGNVGKFDGIIAHDLLRTTPNHVS